MSQYPCRDSVLPFKKAVDDELHALGEPSITLAEALILCDRAVKAAAGETVARRRDRGGPRGWGSRPAPKLARAVTYIEG